MLPNCKLRIGPKIATSETEWNMYVTFVLYTLSLSLPHVHYLFVFYNEHVMPFYLPRLILTLSLSINCSEWRIANSYI